MVPAIIADRCRRFLKPPVGHYDEPHSVLLLSHTESAMSHSPPTATKSLPKQDNGFSYTWLPYLPSFLCYIPAIAMVFSEEASHDAGLALLLAGSGLSILGSLIIRLRNDQMELRRELQKTRQQLIDIHNNPQGE